MIKARLASPARRLMAATVFAGALLLGATVGQPSQAGGFGLGINSGGFSLNFNSGGHFGIRPRFGNNVVVNTPGARVFAGPGSSVVVTPGARVVVPGRNGFRGYRAPNFRRNNVVVATPGARVVVPRGFAPRFRGSRLHNRAFKGHNFKRHNFHRRGFGHRFGRFN